MYSIFQFQITNPDDPIKSPTSSWSSWQSRLGLLCSSQPLKDKRVSSTFIQFNFCHTIPFFIIHNILTKIERCTKDVFSNLKVPQPLIYLASQKNQQMLPWQINSTFIIILFLLVLPGNALFCKGFRGLL